MNARSPRSLGVALVGLAIVLAGCGSAAASPTAAPSTPAGTPAGAASATAVVTTQPSAPPPPSAPGASQVPNVLGHVATFLQDLADAYHGGTLATLAPRLHPAVMARYGEAACPASLGAIQPDATFALRVRSIGPLMTWDWVTDGRTASVRDTVTVAVDVTRSGSTSTAEFHFAFVNGELRWFSDCGTPLA